AGEFLLHGWADALDKVLVAVFLLQLFLELRRQQSQQLSVPSDEWPFSIGCVKDDGIARSSAGHRAAKVAFNRLYMCARFYELHAPRRQARARAKASSRKYPSKCALDQHRRLDFICEQPAELDAPLFVVLLLQDLFRAGELFVMRHLVHGCAEVLR